MSLLRSESVEVVADIRSLPRSNRNPQFDQDQLELLLREAGLRYLYLGNELGGRPQELRFYRSDGRADYRSYRRSAAFQQGIAQLLWWLQRHRVAMMCAEEDPLVCHRFLMNGAELTNLGIRPLHIRKGGTIEKQQDVEERLLIEVGFGDLVKGALFQETPDRAAALEEAYDIQAARCAFRLEPSQMSAWEFGS